jgi:hypothetical protein
MTQSKAIRSIMDTHRRIFGPKLRQKLVLNSRPSATTSSAPAHSARVLPSGCNHSVTDRMV